MIFKNKKNIINHNMINKINNIINKMHNNIIKKMNLLLFIKKKVKTIIMK